MTTPNKLLVLHATGSSRIITHTTTTTTPLIERYAALLLCGQTTRVIALKTTAANRWKQTVPYINGDAERLKMDFNAWYEFLVAIDMIDTNETAPFQGDLVLGDDVATDLIDLVSRYGKSENKIVVMRSLVMQQATRSDTSCAAVPCQSRGNKMCARCNDTWYCSVECQTKHWPLHKTRCHSIEHGCKQQ